MKNSVIIIFLDGVGLGDADSGANPFMHVEMKLLETLFGISHATREVAGLTTGQAALLGVDARLDVPGLPQSATGQTTILTGQNAPALLGKHSGPYPNPALRQLLARENLFRTVREAGYPVAYANAYPERFLDRIKRGKGRLSANTTAARMAGLELRGVEELRQGKAIAALLSNQFWPEPEADLPPCSAYEAGQQLAALATENRLTFFEFWYSDWLGHKMEQVQSVEILKSLDDFLVGVMSRLDLARSLLLIISDHGNFEDWTTKKHTFNPALGMLVGHAAPRLAPKLQALTDVKSVTMAYLFDDEVDFAA